jgi:hypothetical protein
MKGVKCEKVEEDTAIWVWHLNDKITQQWNRLRKEQKLFASTVFYYRIQCSNSLCKKILQV